MDEQDGQDMNEKSCESCLSMFEIFAARETLVFEFLVAKVDEQANFDSCGVQVVDNLSLMLGCDGLDCFQFNNHLLLHEYIHEKVAYTFASE